MQTHLHSVPEPPSSVPDLDLNRAIHRAASHVDESAVDLTHTTQALRIAAAKRLNQPLDSQDITGCMQAVQTQLAILKEQVRDLEAVLRVGGVR